MVGSSVVLRARPPMVLHGPPRRNSGLEAKNGHTIFQVPRANIFRLPNRRFGSLSNRLLYRRWWGFVMHARDCLLNTYGVGRLEIIHPASI